MASLLDYLGYAGNMLDLPGSSVRDILSGRNPFDQWATPFSGDNRATGRDVLNPIFGANKETGMSGWLDDPWEGVKDLAGFGLEVVADPLNLIPAGTLSKVLKGRKAARGANAAIDAVAASPARARLAAELARGFGEEAAAPTMKALDAFALQNKMKPNDVYGKMSVGGRIDNPVNLGDSQLSQLVHHGTPYTFEPEPGFPKGRLRLDKIGTGEGAQIRGRGIYFAESDKLGDLYRRNVASKHLHEKMFDLYDEGDAPFAINQVMENLDYFTPSEQKLLKSLDEHDWLGFDYPHQAIREALSSKVGDRYGDIEGLLDVVKEHGSTYKMDLPDGDIEKMIDQDALLVNQPTHVLNALKKAAVHPELEAYIKEDRRLGLQGQDLLARKYRMTDSGDYGARFQDLMEQIGKNDIAHRALKNNRSPALKAAEVLKNIADLEPGDLALHNQLRHMKGKELTEVLERAMGADEAARFFTSIDIPGARFKDAVSRNANPLQQLTGGKETASTSNYTVWDQDVLDRTALLERNGNTLYQGENPNPNTLYQSPVPEVPAFYSKISELFDNKNKNKLPKMVSQSTLLKRLSESGISKEEIGDVSKSIDDLFSEEEFRHPEWGNNGDYSVGQEFDMPPATGPKNPTLSDGSAAQLFGTPIPMSREEFKIPSQKIKELMEDTVVPKLQVTELSANALKKNAAKRSATHQAINDMAVAARQEEPFLSTGRYSEEFMDQVNSMNEEINQLNEEWNTLGPQFEGQHSLGGGVPGTYREMLIKRPDVGPFAGNHFHKHEGVLAHVRMDDIEIPGGGKTLRIQEVQSDLHQKARKLGYKKEYDPNIKAEVVPLKLEVQPRIEVQDHAEWSSMRDRPYAVVMPGGRKRFFDTMEEAEQAIAHEGHDVIRVVDTDGTLLKETTKIDLPAYLRWNGPTPSELQLHNISGWVQETANKGKMPDAPFKESWTRLSLKKVLDTAVKEGYDSVAVASGKDITKAVAGANPPEDVLKALTLWNEKTIPDHLNKMIVKQGGAMEKVRLENKITTHTYAMDDGTATFHFYADNGRHDLLGTATRSWAGDEFFVRDLDGGRRSFSTLEEAQRHATRHHKNTESDLTVFHLPPSLKQTILEKGQPLYKKNRGMVSFGDDGSALINPINPDFSTAPHEVSHVMRRMLGGEQAGKAADIFGGASGGWSREAEESFAQGAEAYFQNASTTSPGMQQSLQQMNRGFAGVYDNPITTRDGGTEFFRNLLGITENSSPLDRQRIPGIVGPVAAGAAYNAIARYNPRGGVQ